MPKFPNSDRLAKTTFKLTSFTNQQGLYYESHGETRLSHTTWDLVTFLDLKLITSKYDSILTHYEATKKICNQMTENFGSTEIDKTCVLFMQQFKQATSPYLNEIEANHHSLTLVLGYNQTNGYRIRRGKRQSFGRVINVLYGMLSKINVEFIIDKIIELSNNKVQSSNFIFEKTRILQTETNHTVQQIEEHQQKLEKNMEYIQQQILNNTQNIDLLSFGNRMLEQILLFEVILNKYAYETQTLISIINSATNGKIHTSVFTPQTLLEELTEIKMDIPTGSALPVEICIESLTEILHASEINIFVKDNYLVYVIEIPLISSDEYIVYHPIPLPIQYDENRVILVDPEVEYIGVSRDSENFFPLEQNQMEKCIQLKPHKLCKGIQHIQHSAGSKLCAVSLITNQQTNPENCNLKFVHLNSPIWNKLTQTNSWIYYTKPEKGKIVCSNPVETYNMEISGVGRMTISPFCKLHIEKSIIMATNKETRDTFFDVIPENSDDNYLLKLLDIVKLIIPQNITDTLLIHNLNQLADKAIEIGKLPHVSLNTLLIFRIEFYVINLYVFCFIIIIVLLIIIIKLRKKFVKLYKPEIPDETMNGIPEIVI